MKRSPLALLAARVVTLPAARVVTLPAARVVTLPAARVVTLSAARVVTLLAAGLVALGAAGCGATVTVGSSGTLQIAVTEYRVTPQKVAAQAGPLTIVVHNDGRLSHNFVISRGGVVDAATKPIAPGQWTELVTALPAGRYLMASTLLSDQALGAYGTLDVGGH